ncbi:MAG TPA: EI24 domain-containing protein [Novosphingobium sp.]|nr:EI24 domain-containing protein [Novosphingobium sp.]
MLHAFALALGQLGDRRILAVLGKTVLITLAVFAALGAVLWWALAGLPERLGFVADGMLIAVAAAVLAVIGGWLLFRLVALAVLQLYGDEVVAAVEARHYPTAATRVRPLGWSAEVRNGARGLVRSLVYNLVALPVALLLAPTAIGPALVFGAVNAVLLGRELTEMVALRLPGAEPPGFATRTALGAVVVGLLLVPFVNLLAPVLGAATATHLVHRRNPA